MSLFGTKAVSALRVGHRFLLTFGPVFGASDLQKIQPFVEFHSVDLLLMKPMPSVSLQAIKTASHIIAKMPAHVSNICMFVCVHVYIHSQSRSRKVLS